MKWYYWILILLLFAVRFFVSTLSYNNDMNNHFSWVNSIKQNGLMGFYERDFSPFAKANYPPLINESFWVSDRIFEKSGLDDTKIKAALYKTPAVATETIAIVLLGLVFSPWILLVLLINPGIFYNTLLWGQTEDLMAGFIVFCLYFTFREKAYLSWLMFLVALLVKQSALIFLPMILLINCKQFKIKANIYPLLLCIVLFALFFIPYYAGDFLVGAFKFLITESQGQIHQAQASVNALNFWYLIGQNQVADSRQFLGLSYRTIGIILTGLAYIHLMYLAMKRKLDLKKSLILVGLVNFAVCMFMTRVHERHLLPTLIFIVPVILSSYYGLSIYIVTSLISFYNLYLIWQERFKTARFELLAFLSLVLVACYFGFLYLFSKDSK